MKASKIAILLLICCSLFTGVCSAADIPYTTYTISADFTEAESPAAWVPFQTVSSSRLGLESGGNIYDMEAYGDYLYVLDKSGNAVIVLDKEYQPVRTIRSFVVDGEESTFSAPEGLTLAPDGTLYIADTENARIVHLTGEGEFIGVYGRPEIGVLGDYSYRPIKLGVNRAGRIYVVARGVNRGLIELNKDGTFSSFVGAPRVTYDMFTLIWKRLLSKSASQYLESFVPTEFSNVRLDEKGFIYTTIKANDFMQTYQALVSGNQSGIKAVMCINSAGDDVLRRFGDIPILGDVNWLPATDSASVVAADENPSAFEDIVVDESGCYYVLDSRRGRIFSYDSDGNLLYAFGALGVQDGTNQTPRAIELFQGNLVVLDAGLNKLSVYRVTDYGTAIREAAMTYAAGHYEQALESWQEVHKFNGNLTLAYIGMGKSYYRLKDYENAVKYLTLAEETQYCSEAFLKLRTQQMSRYFIPIFAAVVLLLLLLVYFLLRKPREKKPPKRFLKLRSNRVVRGLKYALHLIVHPFDGFWDLKHEKRGNAVSATVILALAVLSFCINSRYAGYFYSGYDPRSFNILLEIVKVLAPVFLFVVSNWCLTTLMDGNGSMKDIYTAVCYSLTPMILILNPLTIASQFLSLNESAYYIFFEVAMYVWIIGLIFFGTMVTHQYSFLKTVVTTVLELIGMLIIVFLLLLLYNVVGTVLTFLSNSWSELSFRFY